MKVVVLTAFGDAEQFEIQTVPIPTLKANQVLVRVCATSINPVDYQTRRGDYKELVRLPAILGVDVSGVIEAIGEAVTRDNLQVGETVLIHAGAGGVGLIAGQRANSRQTSKCTGNLQSDTCSRSLASTLGRTSAARV